MDKLFYDKYVHLVQKGLEREGIEAQLLADGLSNEEVSGFWQAIAQQALLDACDSRHNNNTDNIWRRLAPFQYFEPNYTLPALAQRKIPGHLRVVVISDTHGLHDNMDILPEGDILLHAGDFTDTGDRDEVVAFNEFLKKQPHRYKVVIGGNHESTFDKAYYPTHWQRYGHAVEYDVDEVRSLLTSALYLEDELVLIEGYRIYGTPWQPEFCDWAFNLPRGSLELRSKWTNIPDDVDILLTHTPPLGRGDFVGISHVGDVDLLEQVQNRIKPAYHLFGHVHEGYGMSCDGTTVFINASNCNEDYKATNPIVVFDLPPRLAATKDTEHAYHVKYANQTQQSSTYALKRFRIQGTSGDQVFQEALRRRPIDHANTRAMKYCFQDKAKEIQSAPAPLKEVVAAPNYSVASSRVRRLGKSVSVSVLQPDVPTLIAPSLNQPPSKSIPRPRRLISKSAGLAVLPEEDEVVPAPISASPVAITPPEPPCIMCQYNVPGHVHKPAAPVVEASSAPVVQENKQEDEEECVLCKYKVAGHVHPRPDPPAATIAPEPSTTRDTESAERTGPQKGGQNRVSSWF
ncbi:calcineurin-like phosphoesterase [Thraustotheca clavata]|uniref:Calcineurin-like phosphoesterase n=1 Tax=Thraustotheca clavata TaxID=74557 RepID=A0A1W0A509_9STRA|nr:calcineurin-like phosphoesterase [Thraustotheca clavata]